MSLLNIRTISAIEAVRVLANNPDRCLTVRQVAKTLHVPTPFLRKVVQKLISLGVVKTEPYGGIRIIKPTRKRLLLKIFEVMEDGGDLKVTYF